MREKYENTYYEEIPHHQINFLKDQGKYFDLKIFSAKREDCFLETENDQAKKSYFCIPSISSYITSYARVKLLNALIENEQNNVVYCDTDSVFVDKGSNCIGEMGNELGEWKLEDKIVTDIRGLKNYSYIEDGKEMDAIKGVSKRSIQVAPNHFKVEKYYKTKQALRQNKVTGSIYTQEKKLKNVYTKRIVLNGGKTLPLKLNENIIIELND
jgi:hypothetical protein